MKGPMMVERRGAVLSLEDYARHGCGAETTLSRLVGWGPPLDWRSSPEQIAEADRIAQGLQQQLEEIARRQASGPAADGAATAQDVPQPAAADGAAAAAPIAPGAPADGGGAPD